MPILEDDIPHDSRENESAAPGVRYRTAQLNAQFHYASGEAAIEPPESGDFHDAFLTDAGDVAVILGDVTGHGAQAAKKADLIRREATHQLQRGATPLEALSLVNDQMGEGDNDYATVFVGSVSQWTGELTYASAGHEPSLIAHQLGSETEVETLTTTGPPLGVVPSELHPFEEARTALEPGDTLLAYSDGLTEARQKTQDGKSDWFGLDRLMTLFSQTSKMSPRSAVRHIIESVMAFGQSRLRDDLAVLALRRVRRQSLVPIRKDGAVRRRTRI